MDNIDKAKAEAGMDAVVDASIAASGLAKLSLTASAEQDFPGDAGMQLAAVVIAAVGIFCDTASAISGQPPKGRKALAKLFIDTFDAIGEKRVAQMRRLASGTE